MLDPPRCSRTPNACVYPPFRRAPRGTRPGTIEGKAKRLAAMPSTKRAQRTGKCEGMKNVDRMEMVRNKNVMNEGLKAHGHLARVWGAEEEVRSL